LFERVEKENKEKRNEENLVSPFCFEVRGWFFKTSPYLLKKHTKDERSNGLAGIMDRPSRVNFIPVLSMLGLVTRLYLPKSFSQGEKGGDFLSVLLKKYYPNLD